MAWTLECSKTYTLDKAGNRTNVTDNVNGNATYTPNALNQYSSVSGNTISNGSEHEVSAFNGVTYTYINDERLKQVSDGTNIYNLYYDALGRCIKRSINGTIKYYIYDGDKPILEYDAAGALAARNVYGKGVDELLMRTDYTFNPTAMFYYQHDHAGSATHLTNGSGDVIERYRYDVFGAPTIYPPQPGATPIPASAVSNRFLFTGREYAAAFGFYEYRARAYHPGLGRFTSEDPKLFDAGDYNLYRYCHNDPLDFTDPMGLGIDNPPAPIQQWAAQLAAKRQDLVERAQSTHEMDHTPNASASIRQGFAELARQARGVEGKFYVREGQLAVVNRSRGEAIVVRMESGKGAATNVPEAEALQNEGPLPRGSYRVLSRTADGSQLYKNTGFKGYILAPIDSTPYNDRYDAFGRGSFRMHYGAGVGCLTTCVPRDFARLQSFLERAGTVLQPAVTGWGTQRFYGVLDVNTSIHGY
jgi:RHS repeat-associated protein